MAYIQEARQLKEKVRALFEKYVQRADMVSSAPSPPSPPLLLSPRSASPVPRQVEIAGLNTDLQLEYTRQREHLERNLATLKKKVVKDSELHRTDYVRIMQVPARSSSAPSEAEPSQSREPGKGPFETTQYSELPECPRDPLASPKTFC